LGYKLLATKYGFKDHSQFRKWVSTYKALGEEGIRRKRSKTVYSVQFKLNVLSFIKRTGASYQDAAIEFKLNHPALIANWKRDFLNEGIEGLKEKPKGRPAVPKKRKMKQVEQEGEISRE